MNNNICDFGGGGNFVHELFFLNTNYELIIYHIDSLMRIVDIFIAKILSLVVY